MSKDTASSTQPTSPGVSLLQGLDYSVVQQCMHCGMCLPSCPTYLETKREKNSPRGRIALMRAIADEELELTPAFGEEMYYCLGCLACTTACPAGVDYPVLFETSRAAIEESGVLQTPQRSFWRGLTLRFLFRRQSRLRAVGKLLFLYQRSGLERGIRKLGLTRLLPKRLRELETTTPTIQSQHSDQLIPATAAAAGKKPRYRVGLLTGCVQDLIFSDINRDTFEVLLANDCEIVTPRSQGCCGSLHAHNGDLETARERAEAMFRVFPEFEKLDAIITNAAGCGSHLKHYHNLLPDDPRAVLWDAKVKDISEWLVEIGFRTPGVPVDATVETVTYHEACHLCHGQKISSAPREVLNSIPTLELVELPDATVCCGSAGVYNITQPEQAAKLQADKVEAIRSTAAVIVATANPGCHLQIDNGLGAEAPLRVAHPVSLLAEAYRQENE